MNWLFICIILERVKVGSHNPGSLSILSKLFPLSWTVLLQITIYISLKYNFSIFIFRF